MTKLFDGIISQVVIAVGSNTDSDRAFAIMQHELLTLGEFVLSESVVGQDFTHKTDCVYHNACLKLTLTHPLPYDDLNQRLKYIEIQCGRTKDGDKVAMDLDILAVYDGVWHSVPKRLPFKQHEKAGLIQVAPFLLSI